MKSKLYPAIIIIVICTVVALLMAAVNMVTAPEIKRIEEEKVQNNLSEVYPEGKGFAKIPNESLSEELAESIVAVYTEENGGYVFQMEVRGFKSGLVIMCGVSPEGKIVGAKCITSNETNKVEGTLGGSFIGMDSSNFAPEIVSGSTKTSAAYSNAIKDALDAFEHLTKEESNEK